ncbi:polysaccharide deacetylase family protein [Chryseobacterium populi]|uniref:Putative xylanase/chitin deacetylase n=1 Tax=Chryseobacterium populi TaxID=1144316 RepID=J2KS12_9FLAO|nr:polysaccharide deacetylase family protein [Chryseobacterium populi]EJL75838.1 putative xylanase/chitin deacetylase [Chryseobacterium populi]
MKYYDSFSRNPSNLPEKNKEDTPFFAKKSPEKISKKEETSNPWVNDEDGDKARYYKTRKEAEARMQKLKEKGEWKEYKVESFERNETTFWRVKMRGKQKVKQEKPKEKENPKKDKELPDSPATPSSSSSPTFALTFDDGPHAAELGKSSNLTEKVLDDLKSEGIKAAFFIQTGVSYRGANTVGKALVKRMQAEGHTVGVHTGSKEDHKLHTTSAKDGTLEKDLESAKSYIHTQTGKNPDLVRPPTGAFNKDVSSIYAKTGLQNLMWDIDGDQGKDLSLTDLKARLDTGLTTAKSKGWKPWAQNLSSKIVILYHDIQKGSANNLKTLIQYIKNQVKILGGGSSNFDKP